MTVADPHRDFGHVDYWRERDPTVWRSAHPAGRTGAMLFDSSIDAVAWSTPPVPELVLFFAMTFDAEIELDFAAGRFQTRTQPNAFAVKPPSTATAGRMGVRQENRTLVIPYAKLLQLAGDDSGLPSDGDFGAVHSSLQIDPETTSRVARLWFEMEHGNPRGALYADSTLLHVAARLLEIRDGPHVPSPTLVGGLAPWQVRRVCEAMITALEADVEEASLAELAFMVGLSTHHFCHSFAQSMGVSPHRWMTQQRMARAVVLMQDRKMSLTEISIALGYTSQSAFGRAFARVTGTTPSARRRELLS